MPAPDPTDQTVHDQYLDALDCDAKTLRRAASGTWSVAPAPPYGVRVTNTAYPSAEQDAHSYRVSLVAPEDSDAPVGDGDAHPIPADCECPSAEYHDGDCKHQAALAWVADRELLAAATRKTDPGHDGDNDPAGDGRVEPDGGPRVPTATLAIRLAQRGGEE